MKRLILLFTLLSGVAMAQIPFPAYMPINSSRSFTAGNSTFSNVIARGTLSVGSTASVTGNALFSSSVGIGSLPTSSLSRFRSVTGTGTVDIGAYNNASGGIWINQSSPTTGNCNIFGSSASLEFSGATRIYLDANQVPKMTITSTGVRIGSGVDPTTVLDVTGTMSVSSTATIAGNLTTQARIVANQGTDVASAVGSITLSADGNYFEITGTNAITLISNLLWKNGSEITLIFTSTASLTDGVANSGTDIGFELAGNANFTGSADDLITLVLCEIGGTQRWREKSRSVN